MIELQRWREKRGLNFHLRPKFWPFDPSLADRTICALAAANANPGAFVSGAFAAIFQQERNLGDESEIAAVLAENGYEASWLSRARALETRALYDANGGRALADGVFGSPSYVLDGEIFWGQDRLDILDDALTRKRAPFVVPE
jgi:2-hydroxychromene-2-carboxylate isomerase